jgi:nucleotide-binding universal stress UspA family protein
MHKRIYVPLDNSPYSSAAMRIAIAIGKKAGATMVGSHVYAARLHDQRFRTMESGLPDEYRKEEQLEKQRRTHDSLISRGLEVITDSYLQTMAAACRTEGLEFQGVALEGKNWKELARDIESHNYDLVVMGAYGIGGTSGALLGSVAQRVARRIETDLLIVKQLQEPTENDRVVVCLDGSDRSFGALKLALELGSQFNKKVEAVSVYDPYLHYAVFHSLSNVLSTKARRLFRIEEQEELHEKIIDSGLAKIYQSHLDIAKRIAADDEVPLRTQLLDGKAWRGILRRVREHPPWLLLVGRTGIHGDDALDIGSNTENILRLAPCNILLTARKFRPKREFQVAETVHWTEEARQKMARVPASVKGMASKAVERLAIAEGHTMITSSIVSHAVERLFGPHGQSKPHAARNEGRTCRAQEVTTSFECSSCRYVHHDRRPVRCPMRRNHAW